MADAAPKINKVAVIGAGVMGGGIAAQMADAGVDVVLLDIVPEGAANRNELAESALKKQRESIPPGFVYPGRSGAITCGNLDRRSGQAHRLRLDHRGREGGCPHQAGCLSQDRRAPQARLDHLFQYVDAAARHADLRHAGEFRPRFHDHPFLQPAALHAVARSRPRRRHAPGRGRRHWPLRRPVPRQDGGPEQGYTGLHCQPHRRLLDDAWAGRSRDGAAYPSSKPTRRWVRRPAFPKPASSGCSTWSAST